MHSWKSKYVSSICPGLRLGGGGEEGKKPQTGLSYKYTRETTQLSSAQEVAAELAALDRISRTKKKKKSRKSPVSLLPAIDLKWAYPSHLVHEEEETSWLRGGKTQLLIAPQWASIRSYVAALEDLGWILKISVAMAVIAIHGKSKQWCENNLLFDLVPKTSSFCFLSPKTQAFISLCSVQNWAFHFQQQQGRQQKRGKFRKMSKQTVLSLSFFYGIANGLGQRSGPHSTSLYIWHPPRQSSSASSTWYLPLIKKNKSKKPQRHLFYFQQLEARTFLRWDDLIHT